MTGEKTDRSSQTRSRRQVLQATVGTGVAVALGGLAGCIGGGGDGDSDGDGDPDLVGAPAKATDYDPANVVDPGDTGAVADDYEFDRPDEVQELSGNVSEDTTLGADVVHLVTGSIKVGARLTVEPGAIVEFEQGYSLEVDGGELVAEGTESDPILFTGARESPGWWNGIHLDETQSSVLTYVVVEFGGGNQEGNVDVGSGSGDATVAMSNCTVRHSGANGVTIASGSELSDFGSNRFTDNEGAAVAGVTDNVHYLDGGSDYTGNGEDAVLVSRAGLSEDVTWNVLNVPYRVSGVPEVQGRLGIEAGTMLEFEQDAGLEFDSGVFVAEGTEDAPIVFTATDDIPGWWNGIFVNESPSVDNRLDHVLVEFGGGNREGNVDVGSGSGDATLTITNSTLRHSESNGLVVASGSELPDFGSNRITDNEGVAVSGVASNVHHLDGGSDYTGNGEDAVMVARTNVSEDVTWDALDVPYQMTGVPGIQAGLTIEPGAEFQFTEEAGLKFEAGSTISIEGTEEDPIVFSGTEETPGWWNGIFVDESPSANNQMSNVVVEYGGGGRNGNLDVGSGSGDGSLTVTDSTFRHSASWGLYVASGSEVNEDVCEANEFTDNTEGDCKVE